MSCLNEVNNLTNSGSLKQGEYFQAKIKNYANIKEKMDTIIEPFSSDVSYDIITQNIDYLNNINREDNSKNLENNLGDYANFKNELIDNTKEYNFRNDISNMYLNKIINFSNGKMFYVTNQGIAKYISPEFENTIVGKNGCPSTKIDITIPWNDTYLSKGAVIPTTPSLITGSYMKEHNSCGYGGQSLLNTDIISNSSHKYIGCFKDDINKPTMEMIQNKPYIKDKDFTFRDCKKYAIDGGKKYFGLQNVDPKTEKGYCMVSNLITNAIKNTGVIPNQTVQLWKANFSPNPGTIARLTTSGTLEIMKSNGSTIFSTPSPANELLSNYIGCYNDKGTRALSKFVGNNKTYEDCKNFSNKNNYKYFGLQNLLADPSLKTAQCWASSDLGSATKYGKSQNCSKMSQYQMSGLSWANAVYSSGDTGSHYFLIIEDNGNVSIYKGGNINDKQELIWETKTNGKTLEKNDKYKASKCKFGTNIMKSGTSLASGEFIGSPSGSCYLIMQPDGNLVLYTSKTISGCVPLETYFQGGLTGMNSIYELSQTGNKEDIGSLYYIDQDLNKIKYPDENITNADTFTEMPDYRSDGNNIRKCTKPNFTECLDECKNNPDCYAVDSAKMLKNKNFKNNLYPFIGASMFIRDKKVVENFTGSSNKISKIDTHHINNYSSTSTPVDTLSLSITERDKYLKQLKESSLITDVNKLNTDSNNLQTYFDSSNNQLFNNDKTIRNNYDEYNDNDNQIKVDDKYLNNYNRIVNDSNMVLLQENRIYIFLFIMLILCLIIFIQVIKLNKQ